MIVSFAGSFLREIGGWIAVGDLVRLLGEAGIGEPAIRQALTRLKSRGFLVAEKKGGAAGYSLGALGATDLVRGDRRIFRHGEAAPDAGWVLAVFSVPENARAERHRLRSELSWLGFGTVSAGVWIAPSPLAVPARELLAEAGLDRYVTWFTGTHLGEIEVGKWWDLDALRQMYEEFLDEWRPYTDLAEATDEDAFRRYLQLIDDWRLFPRLDPGLPAALLPADWHGRQAWDLFDQLHRRWLPAAVEHVRSTTAVHQPQ